MAFAPRTWLARIVQHPGRKVLTPTGNTNEFDETRSEGTITQVGDLISAENLNNLETRLANEFAITPEISSGSWTPSLYGTTTAGSPTYASRQGSYYKIGKFVFVLFSVTLSNAGGIQGYLNMRGLPFATSSSGPALFTASSVGAQITAYASGTEIQSLNTPSGAVQNPANDFAIYLGSAWYLTNN